MAFDIAVPADRATLGRTTVGGWPFLGPGNYLTVIPEYTQALTDKLVNADADIAAAINAATAAQTAAQTAQTAAAQLAGHGDTMQTTLAADHQITANLTYLLTTNLTVASTADRYRVDVHLDVEWATAPYCAVVARLQVDGADRPAELVASNSAQTGARFPLHRRYLLPSLPAGPHTLRIATQRLDADAAGSAHAHRIHTDLIIERIK